MQRYEFILNLKKELMGNLYLTLKYFLVSHNWDSLYIWMILHYRMYCDIADI